MSRTARLAVFAGAAAVVTGVLVWALAGLPGFGHYTGTYGRLLNRVAVPQRHTSNVVAAVVFDYRGLDTLGEEFILFTSAMGVAFVLRGSKLVKEQRPVDPVRLEAARLVGAFMVPVTVLVGLWVAAFGYVTPGGGFQGGVAAAGGMVLVWVATSYRNYARLTSPQLMDGLEGSGAGGYVLVGIVGLGLAGAYLANFLPLGTSGTLASGGSIGLLNWAAALEVAAANVLIFREFFQEYIQTFPGVRTED